MTRPQYLSAYMESGAREDQSTHDPDTSAAYTSLTELGTLNTVVKRNSAVVSSQSLISHYRACGKQLPGSVAAVLSIISA